MDASRKLSENRSIRHQIEQLEQRFFVGREREIATFETYINDTSLPHRIINFYGTGGIGKSYLLNELRRRTLQQGVFFILIDSHDLVLTVESFCEHLLHLLCDVCEIERSTIQQERSSNVESCLHNIHKLIGQQRLVIALDTYEEMGSIDYWLRETFMGQLHQQVLFLVAGRIPLQNAWTANPAWARLILKVQLSDLDRASVVEYLDRCSLQEEQQGDVIWDISKGYPLTLSLLAAMADSTQTKQLYKMNEAEILPLVIKRWLLEVPEADLRLLVEAAAIARQFNQEFLAFIIGETISQQAFDQLIQLSFVKRIERGWMLHDMVRESIQRELRVRAPQRFETIRHNCILYYYEKIVGRIGIKQLGWETSELYYYVSGSMIRTMVYEESTFIVRFETLRYEELNEAREYIRKRKLDSKESVIKIFDPGVNRLVDYSISSELSILGLMALEKLDELFALGKDVLSIARNEQGETVGLSAMIPIHYKTLPFLMVEPFSRAYFHSLNEASIASLSVPEHDSAGWYNQIIDVVDFGNPALRNAAAYQLFNYLLAGELLVGSPPPLPYVYRVHELVGIEYIPEMYHYEYGAKFPATYYVVDTRKEKLAVFLDKLLTQAGISKRIKPNVTQKQNSRITELTPREQEIAIQLVEGSTNNEIATALFLSEISVKKHLTSIFRKFDVKNRTQLAKHLNQANKAAE
ncbi:helix-turn-helix transcriptional regulator [Paenibacillus psychroresistens]|uniref:Helix-turn-helix transcriptional regulator n=1 Tax=Paenibacillus psychroresistens TaxID=1778678 RepID=A0A6B8RFP2_9BACL|nr:LuxR family transcriptional regulator [Paenibacillus psychroresistens]QGQ94186.1 helix-turn-helix transcriptional regulator [Paenibacillus psychroresistens]